MTFNQIFNTLYSMYNKVTDTDHKQIYLEVIGTVASFYEIEDGLDLPSYPETTKVLDTLPLIMPSEIEHAYESDMEKYRLWVKSLGVVLTIVLEDNGHGVSPATFHYLLADMLNPRGMDNVFDKLKQDPELIGNYMLSHYTVSKGMKELTIGGEHYWWSGRDL